MVYGGKLQHYGTGSCPHCHKVHGSEFQILESQRSRFKLMQFMAEMSTTFTPPSESGPARPIIHASAKQKFMLGILICGGTTLVAASGHRKKADFERVAKLKGYQICPKQSAMQGPNKSVAGRQIPTGQYMATQCAGASRPGDCAAPRLVQHALANPAMAAKFQDWEMSEVFYQPNTSRRTKDNTYWMHGLSAHHCATCEKLIPLIMCPSE